MEELKKCRACQEEKPLQQFKPSSGCRDGYSRTCKSCFYEKNKDKILQKSKEKYLKNREKCINTIKEYRRKNPEKLKEIKKRPWYKISARIRGRINDWLKSKGLEKGFKLPFSIKELKRHVESVMRDGMSWENYGLWCIDHIKPLSLWNLFNELQRKEANQLKNLQCLWIKENDHKNKYYDHDHPMGWHGLNKFFSDEDKKLLSKRHNYDFGQNKTVDSQI